MNPQETSIKHSALGWVKKSIDDNLSEVKTDLKLFIEEGEAALLDKVKERLVVIQGVLMMIEQYGAAMLTEEMVALADHIATSPREQGEQSLEVMLRAVLQLPDYLEHIQLGHRDIPIAILPLLNDIRAVRNQDLFSEKLLFLPDLSMHQEEAELESIDNDKNQASKLLARKIRPIYQLALLNVIKEQSVEESLKRLEKVCETLEERSFSEQVARIWWIIGALVESVERNQLELGVSIKNLLGKVDALFRVILIIGERGLLQRQPIELIKNFLFYLAQPECDGPKTQAIKTAYRLEQFLPSESVRSEVLDNIAGPNQALMKTVAEAMKADIESVKSRLEVYVNGDLLNVDTLKDLPRDMHIISDTLAMIGLGLQRQLIEAQIEVVKEIVAGKRLADEEQLLSMAAELIQVEQALDQMRKRQPVSAEEPRSEADVSRDYELDSVLMAVVTAALDDIQKTKSAILDFIQDSTRHENIELCISLMQESRGALQLLNQHRAVEVVDGLLAYLNGYEPEDFLEPGRLDALSQVVVSLEYYLEALGEKRSDANSILDFADVQLQDLLAHVQSRQKSLEDSQELVILDEEAQAEPATQTDADTGSLPDLAEVPAPLTDIVAPGTETPDNAAVADTDSRATSIPGEASESEEETVEPIVAAEISIDESVETQPEDTQAGEVLLPDDSAEGAPQVEPILDDVDDDSLQLIDDTAVTESVADQLPSVEPVSVVPVDDDLPILKSGSDPEILEIYLEEAEEEARNIARLQQDWMLHPEDENALKNIRRAFHTIKGSGRLVGAMKIGEFAWDYEQLLNRVIDKTVPPDRQVIDAVGQAATALSELANELQTSQPPTTDINYLRGLARALAEFKAGQLLVNQRLRANRVESPHDHITDGDDTEWKGIGVGGTTQVIPPDRLKKALLEEIEPDTMRVDLQAFESNLPEAGSDDETELSQSDVNFDDTLTTRPAAIPATPSDDSSSDEEDASGEVVADAFEPEYTQAIDYARLRSEQDADGAAVTKNIELDDEPGEIELEPASEIEVASFGEDFPEDESDAEVVAENSIELDSEGNDEAGSEADSLLGQGPGFEGLTIVEEPQPEEVVLQAAGDSDGELIESAAELEAEEIDVAAPEAANYDELIENVSEVEAEEIEMAEPEAGSDDELIESAAELEAEEIDVAAPEAANYDELIENVSELEAEEIEMAEPEAGSDDELIESAAELEAEEIEMTTPDAEGDADLLGAETAVDNSEAEDFSPPESVSISEQWDSSTGEQDISATSTDPSTEVEGDSAQESPPDPFVDTTGSPMPGEEAGDSLPGTQEPAEPIGLSFDPELLIIYQQEVEQHLGTVNFALDRAEDIQELIPGEEIYRALHTIHGASRTADITTIGELAGLMEKPLKAAISQKMGLDQEIIALYREGQHALQAMTRELVASRQAPPIPGDLEISLRALAEDLEEHTVEIPEHEGEQSGEFIDTLTMMNEGASVEQDNELLSIFIDEANELLEMSDNTLYEWSRQTAEEPNAQDFSAVMELQRYLHTLKGGARMAELKEISDLSHEMESMFIAVIDGRVERNDNLVELLRDCFDLLHQQVLEAQERRDPSLSRDLVENLRNMRLRYGEDGEDEFLDDDSRYDMDSEDIDIVSENLPGEPLSGVERPSQDVIKVRSELLDNLVNSAGEVSIYRARMEQQVAGLGSYLGELGQTISRLKGQLRNLEAETDAQIHFSHRAEAGRTGEFDPLEMDRYTMIQELSRSLGESVNDLSSLQTMLGEQVKDSETLLLQQSRVSTDLQDGLIKSRMVKFSGLLSRLRRLVRQSSQELGKKAELLITGEENEVDNKVLDRMVAPLEHIIRNALSHGIETPVERVKKGKPEIGRLAIDITRDGSDIVIQVSDDGAGVDIEKVRSRAVQLGLLDEKHQVTEADLVQYILEPGFSTAEHVTQLSGRGVGMDVVDIEIKQLGGTLQIETTPQGSTFTARLPFTLSINQAILVRVGDEIYAIPLINIEGITRVEAQQMVEYYRQDAPELDYAGQQFLLHSLATLVESEIQPRTGVEVDKQPIILSRAGDVRVALHVDEILGNREIVVKTLGKQLSQVKGLAGASILADGSVVLILDINGLVRHGSGSAVKIVYRQPEQSKKTRSTVMVVDDSITMRRVASKLLERHNYEVVTAKDGVDALAQLQDLQPDVMLLDIEMPRMDGFELATHMQNEQNFSKIPIIMITSRTGEKHRDRALEIGVNNYMGKPYQEDELIKNIQNALAAG